MPDRSNAPIIIKRKKIIAAGHHGGAWKVAYADFVTAMMAFFLLMWLLNATTEQQRTGLADYFSPTIPVHRISGGGDGLFGGADMMSDDIAADVGVGAKAGVPIEDGLYGDQEAAVELAALQDIEAALLGIGGESLVQQGALRHVISRLSDDGLIVEVYARDGEPLFINNGTEPTPLLVELVQMFAEVFAMVKNPVAVDGHTRSAPLVVANHPVWDISNGRAATIRDLLLSGDLDPARIVRMTGHGDRDHVDANPLSVRNDRIEITLLRTQN